MIAPVTPRSGSMNMYLDSFWKMGASCEQPPLLEFDDEVQQFPPASAALKAPVSALSTTAIDTLWYSGKVQKHSRRVRFVQKHTRSVRFAPSTKAMIDDSDISHLTVESASGSESDSEPCTPRYSPRFKNSLSRATVSPFH
jgi:hypothetical protein